MTIFAAWLAVLGLAPSKTIPPEAAHIAARGTMTEAIVKMCDFLIEKRQTAAALAQRFGMHAHDDGSSVTFTPRDRRFSRGSAGKHGASDVLNDVDLDVERNAILTVGDMRTAFGKFSKIDGEHYDTPPRWTASYAGAGRQLECDVVFELAVGFPKGELTDDLQIKRVSLIPGRKL